MGRGNVRVTVGSIVLCGAEGLPLLCGCGASFVCTGEGHPWGWVCLPVARGCWGEGPLGPRIHSCLRQEAGTVTP